MAEVTTVGDSLENLQAWLSTGFGALLACTFVFKCLAINSEFKPPTKLRKTVVNSGNINYRK